MDNSEETNRPFLSLTTEECRERKTVPATITYRMCNDNNFSFNPISAKHAIRYEGNTVKPSYWDFRLDPNECRNYVLSETIDLCDEKRVIDIEMDGNLDKAFPRYCRCYLYKEMNIELKTLEEPPKQTAAPTQSPKVPVAEPPSAPSPPTNVGMEYLPFGFERKCYTEASNCNLSVSCIWIGFFFCSCFFLFMFSLIHHQRSYFI